MAKGRSSPRERASLTELFFFSNAQVTTIAEALALHKSLGEQGHRSGTKEVDEHTRTRTERVQQEDLRRSETPGADLRERRSLCFLYIRVTDKVDAAGVSPNSTRTRRPNRSRSIEIRDRRLPVPFSRRAGGAFGACHLSAASQETMGAGDQPGRVRRRRRAGAEAQSVRGCGVGGVARREGRQGECRRRGHRQGHADILARLNRTRTGAVAKDGKPARKAVDDREWRALLGGGSGSGPVGTKPPKSKEAAAARPRRRARLRLRRRGGSRGGSRAHGRGGEGEGDAELRREADGGGEDVRERPAKRRRRRNATPRRNTAGSIPFCCSWRNKRNSTCWTRPRWTGAR